MKLVFLFAAAVVCAFLLLRAAGQETTEERLARHRNLGKAFYENPTTPNEAVEEFRKAFALAPESAPDRLNYGLSLLRAGKTDDAIKELIAVQKQAPSIPHTWFNLGIAYKKAGEQDKAIEQFERMVQLAPGDAISHYNLGALYRLVGRNEDAIREFRTTAKLDPTLAAPHFQLFNLLRTTGRADQAKPELAIFQRLKKEQEGAVIAEDVEWNMFAEVYEVMADTAAPDKPAELKFEARTAPSQPSQPYTLIDFDHDNDLDRIQLAGKPSLQRNQGPAGFQPFKFPFVEGDARSAAVLRVVPDTKGFDLLITYADRGAVLYRDKLQGNYEPEDTLIPAGAINLTAADLNNDGWIDVAYTGGDGTYVSWNRNGKFTPGERVSEAGSAFAIEDLENRGAMDIVLGPTVLRSDRKGGFTTRQAGLAECAQWHTGDFDRDGRIDLACGSRQFLNKTQSGNAWIGVKLTGVKSVKTAHGAEVEVKAGPRYQKKIYNGEPLVFGLGNQKEADAVRITWPNGLIQNEIKQSAGKHYSYEEAQRLSGSCPIIWTWNGREFEYITDVLGVAPLGASSGNGEYFPVDHDEYIQIPGKSLVPVGGEYRVRITEELSEVAYIDHIKLIAVDHPAGMEVFTNDKFKGPPFPEFRLYGIRDRIRPKSARTSDGRNVLDRILATDGRYPDDFSRNLSGVAGLHHLELDFGLGIKDDAVLILSGWVDWADGSTFLGVAQHGTGGLVTPYLQVKDQQGKWQTIIEDMGMPAGKPKTISVGLTGKWLSASREVRIVTNLCVYWDEVFLSEDTAQPDVRLSPAVMQTAGLNFRGFSPAVIHPERKQPERFTYAGARPASMWNPTPGLYTRYGDVRELTAAVDDKMIVMGSGDELQLTFTALPPPPRGWTRDFLLLVDGWAKDRDPNTAHGQSTEPLPFHEMSRFPYPASERFPDTQEHREYIRQYNTRPALKLIRPLRQSESTAVASR
jgi:hypothetical protein